jgi:hypothetical protein
MKTNFFDHIANLNAPGIWKLGIQNDINGNFVVSALYSPLQSNEPALKTIAPLIFKGTAAEMGEGFFEAIEKPVQETAGTEQAQSRPYPQKGTDGASTKIV